MRRSAQRSREAASTGSRWCRVRAYTYVTDKQTWYHAAGDFTAAEELTVDAQTPNTIDALDSLYLATKGTKIQSNDQVRLAVPAGAKHAYAFSVADYSSSLYCWAKAEGYTFTAVETGNTITSKAATAHGAASDQLPENRGRYADADHPGFPRWRGRDLLSGLRHHHI